MRTVVHVRNALQGKIDYAYGCQLNSYVVGGGLNNVHDSGQL
jgi:hypothetical protein